MRNISVLRELNNTLTLDTTFGTASCLSIDSDAGVFYVAGQGLAVACHRIDGGQELWRVMLPEAAQDAGCDMVPDASITHFAHVPELEAVCIGLSTGELLLLETNAQQGSRLEEVGSVEGGVMAGQWSPDGEVLALLSGVGQLLLMSKDWELLGEAGVAGEDGCALTPDSVALSWRGDARYLATCTPLAGAAEGEGGSGSLRVQIWEREGCELHAVGEEAPALYPLLSWQPNGRHLYAARALGSSLQAQQAQHGVAAVDEQAQQARIGAWKREMRRKEAEAAAAAAAAGEAANRVVLFETNGLQHGGFDLPGAGALLRMLWSPDSQLLAAVVRDESGKDPPSCRLQLWHRSNWHWYLKYERRYTPCQDLAVQWDDMVPRQLHVLTGEGDYQQMEFCWDPLISHRGTAAVVDGRRLLLTPLRHSVVPPPLCSAAIRFSAPLACAALCDFGGAEVAAAVLGSGGLELAASCEEDLWEETCEEHLECASDSPLDGRDSAAQGVDLTIPATPLRLEGGVEVGGARQAAWAGEGRLVVLRGGGELLEIQVDLAAAAASAAGRMAAPAPVLRLASRPGGGCVVQLEGGQLLEYCRTGQLEVSAAGNFPTACPCMRPTPLATLEALGPAAPVALGLSPKGVLYWGPQQLATEVTSFALRCEGAGGDLLLYTTRSHHLHALPLASLQQYGRGAAVSTLRYANGTAPGAQPPQQQAQQSFSQAMRAAMRPSGQLEGAMDVRVRAVEQDAVLVAAPLGGEVVVLQMPRGNLEAVRPRALVLAAVAAAIDCGDYGTAWELAAANRLDLNVLVDYRWPSFLDHVEDFVQQVSSDQDIADLLSSLTPSSTVSEGGLYCGALPPPGAQPAAHGASSAHGLGDAATRGLLLSTGPTAVGGGGGLPVSVEVATGGEGSARGEATGKVEAVCTAMRRVLEVKGVARYLRSVLTSFAKCGELEGALGVVKERKEAELGGTPLESLPSAEDGLKHLLLFTNEDVVYRAALGMYDLPLAYMVVAHSQKDPGEYMMELQRFAALPEGPLRRHAIDLHLRRFDRALRALVEAGEGHQDQALELAREKGLLRQLLTLYEDSPELRRRALEAYGEELERRNMDEDAGLVFMAAGMPERAIEAYVVAGQWRMAMALAGKLGKAPEAVRRLASELASELAGSARVADAAAVTLEYLQDVGGAVDLLTRAKEWREALRVSYSHGRSDLVESLVAPSAAAAAAEALHDIAEDTERVHKYSARLREIRQKRRDMEAVLAAAEEESGLPSRHRGELDCDDAASEAPSMLSGLSVYTDRTHAGGTATSGGSSRAPSTLGGRGGKRRTKKSKGTRIRQGSPEEEQQLAQHLLSLAPSTALCSQVGQLSEALVLLGHEQDGRVLQQRLAELVAAQQAAVQDVLHNPPPALAVELTLKVKQALQAEQAKQAGTGGGLPPGLLAAAVAGVLGATPGPELQLKAAQVEEGLKAARWKWDLFRDA